MTIEKIIEKLREFAEQGVKRVTDEEGNCIIGVYDPVESKKYAVIITVEDSDMEIDEVIDKLEECNKEKYVINDNMAEIEDVIYENLITPTAVLVYSREVRA